MYLLVRVDHYKNDFIESIEGIFEDLDRAQAALEEWNSSVAQAIEKEPWLSTVMNVEIREYDPCKYKDIVTVYRIGTDSDGNEMERTQFAVPRCVVNQFAENWWNWTQPILETDVVWVFYSIESFEDALAKGHKKISKRPLDSGR